MVVVNIHTVKHIRICEFFGAGYFEKHTKLNASKLNIDVVRFKFNVSIAISIRLRVSFLSHPASISLHSTHQLSRMLLGSCLFLLLSY